MVGPVVTTSIQLLVGVGVFSISAPIQGNDGGAVRSVPGIRSASVSEASVRSSLAESPASATGAVDGHDPGSPGWTALVLGLWGLGAAASLCVRLVRRRSFRRLMRDRRTRVDPWLVGTLDHIRDRLAVGQTVRLSCSEELPAPVVLDSREICVPMRAFSELSEAEWLGLLGHEIAHIQRRDPWWLDALGWLQALFFFQLLNRVAAGEIRRSAEEQCDGLVVERLDAGRALASCLVKVGRWLKPNPVSIPLATMASRRSELDQRLTRLLDPGAQSGPEPALSRKDRLAVGTAMIVALVALGPGVRSETTAPLHTTFAPGSETAAVSESADGSQAASGGWTAHGAMIRTAADARRLAGIVGGGDDARTTIRRRLTGLLEAREPGLYVQLDGSAGGSRVAFVPSETGRLGLRAPGLSLDLGDWDWQSDPVAVFVVDGSRGDTTEYVVYVPAVSLRLTLVAGKSVLADRIDLGVGAESIRYPLPAAD
jgi:beta-lactamase regulating signal transducer with metallopeptidase domain